MQPQQIPGLAPSYPPINDYSDLMLYALLFIIFLILAFYFWPKRVNPGIPKSETQKQSSWAETYALFSGSLPNDFKRFYFITSEKLKLFVEKELQLPIAEMTTREIVEYLSEHKISSPEYLLQALALADPVKFAKVVPTPDDFQEYLRYAKRFLEENRGAK